MAENDIYDSKGQYERFKARLPELTSEPPAGSKRKYWIKNKANLQYFEKLFLRFESKDVSYVRRIRLSRTVIVIMHHTAKKLNTLDREDIDGIIAEMHKSYKSPRSKSDFLKDIKYVWKVFLPEKDSKGRDDETVIPYVVRHISGRVDKSKDKTRNDKLSFDEFHRILDFFSNDRRMQAYLMLALESIARPQELLYRRIRDIDLRDGYAIITLSDHGKEGTGILQCIDSFPFLMKWLDTHLFKNDPHSFIFINKCMNS